MIEGVDDRSLPPWACVESVDESSIMRLARWLGTAWPPDIPPRERGFAAHIRKENSAKPENFKLRHSAKVSGRP
jgi:hypothetical protein